MCSKDIYAIREWAPLTEIIERIPTHVQRGFFPADLNLTCIAAVADFLAIGSDAGIVFWYDRYTGEVQKLKAENNARITCCKIVDSVEYMLAAGNAIGQVSVFQIQKAVPPDLNLVAPCTRPKPIERYTIRELHHAAVSCCEWSKNGMKLYSGDKLGVVVLTEFDYQTHQSKSQQILSESYEIVQLSVRKSQLLVSTLYRSILCQRSAETGDWNIIQIGKKDRKNLVDCGGVFAKHTAQLICGRPGLRFWLANLTGEVEKTLIFKEAVACSPNWEIPMLNPKFGTLRQRMQNEATDVTAQNFRQIELYANEDLLVVTHDEHCLYILNLQTLRVEAMTRGFRKILDFCVCDKEIFVLEGERSLLRLAPKPEKPKKNAKIIFNPQLPPPVPALSAVLSSSSIETPSECEPAQTNINASLNRAEECFELPAIETLDLNIPIELAVESPRAEQNRRLEIFKQISEMDFDQPILHHSKMRKTKERHKEQVPQKSAGIVEIAHIAVDDQECSSSNSSREKPKTLALTNTALPMEASYCAVEQTSAAVLTQHLIELPTPRTLERTIKEKTKALLEDLQTPIEKAAITTTDGNKKPQPKPPPGTPNTNATMSAKISSIPTLANAYPLVENVEVQTTPRKKVFYIDESDDYEHGQPVDGICAHITTNIVEQATASGTSSVAPPQQPPLKFVATRPINEDDINSFLLDFKRAEDPLRKQTPPSAESNNSSEWEFLDN